MEDNESVDNYLSPADVHARLDAYVANSTNSFLGNNNDNDTNGTTLMFHAQAMAVIPTFRFQIDKNRSRNKRGVFYCHNGEKGVFITEQDCNNFLDTFLPRLGLLPIHVNIIPNTKGKIAASSSIIFIFNEGTDCEKRYDYAPTRQYAMHDEPSAMDAFLEVPLDEQNVGILEELADDVEVATLRFETNGYPVWLLIFEKEDWMKALARAGFFDQYHAIAICTKGYASHNTYALVKMLHTQWPRMKIVAFNDAAPSGLDIAMRFYYMNSVGARFSVPINIGGLLVTDIINDEGTLNAMNHTMSAFTNWDWTCIGRITDHPWTDACRHGTRAMSLINTMSDGERKWDMNSFNPTEGSITDFIIDILDNDRYLLGPSAAMRYD